jgi:hypothetical protein
MLPQLRRSSLLSVHEEHSSGASRPEGPVRLLIEAAFNLPQE